MYVLSASDNGLGRLPLRQMGQSALFPRLQRRRAHARDDIRQRMSSTLHVRHAAATLGVSAAPQTQVSSTTDGCLAVSTTLIPISPTIC